MAKSDDTLRGNPAATRLEIQVESLLRWRSAIFASVTLGLTMIALFAVGEIACRVFWPDGQLHYETDPIALFRFAPSQTGYVTLNDGTQVSPTTLNRYGFRGPDRPIDARRSILLLGDSFTFGSGVNDGETFAMQLDRALGREVHVWNGAQPGYGVYQMQATLDRVGDVLRPERVVVVIWQGDFLRQPLPESEKMELLRRSRAMKALKSSVLVTQLYRRTERAALNFGLGGLALVGETTVPEGNEAIIAAHHAGLQADLPRLRALHARASQARSGLIVVLWPKENFANFAVPGLATLLTTELRRFGEAEGITFLSLQSAFAAAAPEKLLIPNDGHPTAFAHCIAARRIAEGLADLGETIAQPVHCDGESF